MRWRRPGYGDDFRAPELKSPAQPLAVRLIFQRFRAARYTTGLGRAASRVVDAYRARLAELGCGAPPESAISSRQGKRCSGQQWPGSVSASRLFEPTHPGGGPSASAVASAWPVSVLGARTQIHDVLPQGSQQLRGFARRDQVIRRALKNMRPRCHTTMLNANRKKHHDSTWHSHCAGPQSGRSRGSTRK